MLQMLGIFSIIFGTLGLGIKIIEKEIKIIGVIEKWGQILQMFLSEIIYKKQPLFLACDEIGKKIDGREGELLKKIGFRMQEDKGGGFKKIWSEEVENYFKEVKINTEAKALIEEFGVLTGFEDEIIQKKMIEEQKEKWKKMEIKIREEHQERKRIILLLSSCLGVMVVLILW